MKYSETLTQYAGISHSYVLDRLFILQEGMSCRHPKEPGQSSSTLRI